MKSRDFDSAIACFETATAARGGDYALWNKLGATRANGAKSEDALPAYYKALELKVSLFTVTFHANPANDLTCPPSYIVI